MKRTIIDIAQFVKLSDEEFERFYDILAFKKYKKRADLSSIVSICKNAFSIIVVVHSLLIVYPATKFSRIFSVECTTPIS